MPPKPQEKLEIPAVKEKVSTEELPRLKEEMKNLLFKIDRYAHEESYTEKQMKEVLAAIKKQAAVLGKKYPGDMDLKMIKEMAEDLEDDLKYRDSVDLDTSFNAIENEMKQELEKSGVKKQPIESIEDPALKETVAKLKECGITPEYLVTQGGKDAPTIVLFMQMHDNPGVPKEILKAAGVFESQDAIFKAIIAASGKKLIQTVYMEGVGVGQEMDQKFLEEWNVPEDDPMAVTRAERQLKEKIKTLGIESMDLFEALLENPKRLFRYRTTANNIFLGENTAEQVKSKKEAISFLVMGANHENPEPPSVPIIPLSHTIAYRGVNMFVVDESTKYNDPEKLREAIDAYRRKQEQENFY